MDEIEDLLKEYILIGTEIYNIQEQPGVLEGQVYKDVIVPWNFKILNQRLPRHMAKRLIQEMKEYKGFVFRPQHINYSRDVEQGKYIFYNKYAPLPFSPVKGSYTTTLNFLNHIFGEQLQLGLDYLQLLYLRPLQPQYILCLVSKERVTGKSTFLEWNLNFIIHTFGRKAQPSILHQPAQSLPEAAQLFARNRTGFRTDMHIFKN